jgi:pantoate--beta-alanine ligase
MAGTRVLVPTMGALHEGHFALVRRARELAGPAGMVVVSIFVNPIQFDRKDDLEAYPQPLEEDLGHCQRLGVDLVFVPDAGAMYAGDRSTLVCERDVSSGLCGAARPGHFDGVCTVVLKLFLLTRCDVAVFGEKDFQQLAVIRRMVRDLDVPVVVIGHPTVREVDGLAMSSRNVRLSPEQRADAPKIARILKQASRLGGDVDAMLSYVQQEVEAGGLARVEYVRVVDRDSLQDVPRVVGPVLLAVAVFYGAVRLIDHVEMNCVP